MYFENHNEEFLHMLLSYTIYMQRMFDLHEKLNFR
jgi:hypothetical protein